MATMYPAIKAQIGRWTYYIVKLKIGDLAKEVQLSSDVHQNRTLDEAIQREIKESRAKQDLVVYLHDREDRFLNSIVVAALGGAPTFTQLKLADTPENQIFSAMQIDQSFGVLTFAGGEKYYALDGQHRLAAIKTILNPTDAHADKFARDYVTEGFRQAFRDEELSVIMVVQDPGSDQTVRNEVLKDYRRLFSSLNRYAKPTKEHTNIIMDEDDGIAILTRRLIAEHEFFKWEVEQPSEYSIVKTAGGKNLTQKDSYFTQIEVLYEMNRILLTSAGRSARGWPSRKHELPVPQKNFSTIWRINRPDEEFLDDYYAELEAYWDGLLATLPDLRNSPTDMRVHNPASGQNSETSKDHALFWPIAQPMLATVARELLDEFSTLNGIDQLDRKAIEMALTPLSRVEWSLHQPPWRHLLLVQIRDKAGNQVWAMRSESRAAAARVAQEILEFVVRATQLDQNGQDALRERWKENLVPVPDDAIAEEMWQSVLRQGFAVS